MTLTHLEPNQSIRAADGSRWERKQVNHTQWGTETVYTNVEWNAGGCLGGDAHWLTVAAADRALTDHLTDAENTLTDGS